MQSNDTPTPTTQDTGRILDSIESTLDTLYAMEARLSGLAAALMPISTPGMLDEVAAWLNQSRVHVESSPESSGLDCVGGSMYRRAFNLHAALGALRAGVRL